MRCCGNSISSPASRAGTIPRIITNRRSGDLNAIVTAALSACDPAALLSRAIARHPVPADAGIVVVAAGKGAVRMADAFTRLHGAQVREVLISRGAHPVPDSASVEAGRRALVLARETRARGDLLVVLLSGGASSMMAVPADGMALEDKVALNRFLLRSGLAIAEINAIRKHVSAIKGGQLAAAAGRSITFAISDVHSPIEDDPAVIGSGPTVADPSTFADALRALGRTGVEPASDPGQTGVEPGSDEGQTTFAGLIASGRDDLSPRIVEYLQRGARGEKAETPKPGDPRLSDAEFVLAGSRQDAMDGAQREAERLGYTVERITAPTLGAAAAAGRAFAQEAQARARRTGRRICVIASGETTVTLTGTTGVGGRNQEFALAAALAMAAADSHRSARIDAVALASVGTDGIDGPTDAAGAIVDSTTIARAKAMGLDANVALARHDSHSFFQALGDLVITGPTGTNVGDVQVFISGWSR